MRYKRSAGFPTAFSIQVRFKMQSKITVGFLLAACVSSCLAVCQLEVGGTAESYLCEAITDLQALSTIPATAQRITIVNSRILSLPGSGLARFGGTLVYLNITNSALNDIKPGAFTGLTALRHLILDHNDIKSIKTNWIKDLTELETLRVWHNHITEIEPEVFDHLSDLEILDIAYNQIDHCLSTESLGKLKSLETIYLTGNPWPLRCRPPVIFHLENHHVQVVNTWKNNHILIAECLAHEPHAQWNDDVLQKCVDSLAGNLPVAAPVTPHH